MISSYMLKNPEIKRWVNAYELWLESLSWTELNYQFTMNCDNEIIVFISPHPDWLAMHACHG